MTEGICARAQCETTQTFVHLLLDGRPTIRVMKPQPKSEGASRAHPNQEGQPAPSSGRRPPGFRSGCSLEQVAEAVGGRAALAELASYCRDPKVNAVLARCKPSKEAKRSLAELCEEVGITPAYFVGQVVATMWKWNLDVSKLVVSQSLPQIIAKTAERALASDGYKDRQMFLKHMAAPNQFALLYREKALQQVGGTKESRVPQR